MQLFGRKVIFTSLDPVPKSFRTGPGVLVLNEREAYALAHNEGGVFKRIAKMIHEADKEEMRNAA